MEQRNTTGILILLLTVMLVTAGCGWFAGDEYPGSEAPDASPGTSSSAGLSAADAAFRMVNTYYNITTVTPSEGPLAGGNAVRFNGTFPAVTGAQFIYTFYIGDNIASYNLGAFPFFTPTEVQVIAPPGDALGLVSVSMFDKSAAMYTIYNGDAYAYVDPFEITAVDPQGGLLAGGTDVTVFGRIPVTAPITSLADAQANYGVTFDGNAATFVPNALGQYITTGAMYVQTPPGTVPGLVDVDATAGSFGARTLTDGYRYLSDFELIDLDPDSGHISGLNTVIVEGSFPVINAIYDLSVASAQYTVYFGNQIANFVVPPDAQAIISTEMMYVAAPPSPIATVVDVDVFSDNNGAQALVSDASVNDYEYFTFMKIGEVYPDSGFLGVFTPVQVLAKLPITSSVSNLTTANNMYQVEFDGDPAFYNSLVDPIIEITAAYGEYNALLNMFTPPGTVAGPVDVSIIDVANVEPPSKLEDGYEYLKIMEISEVYPDSGPTSGGTQVDVLVNIPSEITIIDLVSTAAADAIYSVYFDGLEASFDLSRQPLIGFNAAATTYNTYFHMITPARTPPGFVDVTLVDETGPAPDEIGVDFYEYVSGSGIGQWTDVTINPRPVGPVQSGELEVTITVSDTFGNSSAFIVPQGGDPLNVNHRIPLTIETPNPTTFATATNAVAITTVIYEAGATNVLFADGHAAVYLQDENGNIIGDNYVDLTDGGSIGGDAVNDRHFIIDTLPPIQFVSGTGIADEFVTITNPLETSYQFQNLGAPDHPYILPASNAQPFPWSADPILNLGIGSPSTLSPRGAQRFFNPMSVSNNLIFDQTFKPFVLVDFFDYDISSHPDYISLPSTGATNPLNEDLFNPGDFVRWPAGFSQLSSTGFDEGESREILLATPPVPERPARWELQGGTNASVANTYSEVYFEPSGTTLGGFVYDNGFDETPVNQLRAIWNVYDGFERDAVADPMRLVVKFAASDRAGIFYPRGDTSLDARAYMTPSAYQLDPLQIWWMREVNTQIIVDNIPADGITRQPRFEWVVANSPRPPLDSDPVAPQYLVEVWESDDQSVNPDDYRDRSYTKIYETGWMFNSAFDPLNPAVVPLRDNYWYIVSVMSADEAHNAEVWPQSELARPGSGNISMVSSNSLQGDNWRRFFYGSDYSEVDTTVTWTFWYDDNNNGRNDLPEDAGELRFANRTIVPAPADRNTTLLAIFTGRVITERTETQQIDWSLTENGILQQSATRTPAQLFTSIQLGDPNRLRPFNYVVTARGSLNTSPSITDDTPANVRITVVPEEDITTYLTNRLSDDQQPIIEFDRQ